LFSIFLIRHLNFTTKQERISLYFGHFLKVVYDDDYENGALWIKVRKLKRE